MPRVTVLLVMLTAGCATARNVARARELGDCVEERVEQVAYQRSSEGPQLEPAPELVWYRACATTVVCLAGDPADCFEASPPVSSTPLVVVERCGASRCLRPRLEYALPGLTHAQTVRRAELIAERAAVGPLPQPTPRGQSVCSSGQATGGTPWSARHSADGGVAAAILLPFFAVIGLVSLTCNIDAKIAAHQHRRARQLDEEIAEYDRLRPPAPPP